MSVPEHDRSIPQVGAHEHSSKDREEIERSELCGCFYCLAMFPPARVSEWIDDVNDVGTTAMCPECGIDSVIGAASGFPISAEFLGAMHAYWFGAQAVRGVLRRGLRRFHPPIKSPSNDGLSALAHPGRRI